MFFEVLMQALQTLSTQLGAVGDEFMENLAALAREVAATARPMSATSSSFPAVAGPWRLRCTPHPAPSVLPGARLISRHPG